jgi:hypothetical protein
MRWNEPKELDERYRTFFAFLPVTINGESRWLEIVRVREVYKRIFSYGRGWWYMTNFEPLHKKERSTK